MAETQWPRFYVFEQPEAGAPLIHAGSVHAPDREMALLIARDVFGRRPERTSMWVVRDRDILSRTKEELAVQLPEPDLENEGPESRFHVFAKLKQKGVPFQLGDVRTVTSEGALAKALAEFPAGALVWWVFPDQAVERSTAGDRSSLFESSPGKFFRHESHYPVRTMMMELKQKKKRE